MAVIWPIVVESEGAVPPVRREAWAAGAAAAAAAERVARGALGVAVLGAAGAATERAGAVGPVRRRGGGSGVRGGSVILLRMRCWMAMSRSSCTPSSKRTVIVGGCNATTVNVPLRWVYCSPTTNSVGLITISSVPPAGSPRAYSAAAVAGVLDLVAGLAAARDPLRARGGGSGVRGGSVILLRMRCWILMSSVSSVPSSKRTVIVGGCNSTTVKVPLRLVYCSPLTNSVGLIIWLSFPFRAAGYSDVSVRGQTRPDPRSRAIG